MTTTQRVLTLGAALAAALLLTGTARAEMVQVEDWLMVDQPATATVGEPLTIKLKITGFESGQLVSVHLHYRKTDGSYAGVNKAGRAVLIPENGEVEVTLTPNPKPELASLIPTIFTSTDGTWKNKVKKTNAPEIPVTP